MSITEIISVLFVVLIGGVALLGSIAAVFGLWPGGDE